MRSIVVVALLTLLAACAASPRPEPSAAIAQPGSVVPPAPPVTPVPTPAATVAEAAPSGGDFSVPAGYQKKTRGNTTVYCRTQTPVGTRFGTEYCYTQADLERMEANKRSVQQEVDRNRRVCGAAGCAGGG